MPPRSRQIALAFPIGTPYLEAVIRGVMDRAQIHGNWQFAFSPDAASVPIQSLRDWDGDGVIAWLPTPPEIKAARRLGIPVINLSAQQQDMSLPLVTSDQQATGRSAAEHLLSKRFRRFGFYGLRDTHYSDLRGEGFRKAIEDAGYSCSICLAENTIDADQPWRWDAPQVEHWLQSLETPVGILAAHDYRARVILVACARLGLRVPEDVAVIGVNNDVVTCAFCQPTLSSVTVDGVQVGRAAADLLEQLMRGQAAPEQPVLIPPTGLVERDSTRTVAVDDPRVAAPPNFCWNTPESASVWKMRRATQAYRGACSKCVSHPCSAARRTNISHAIASSLPRQRWPIRRDSN